MKKIKECDLGRSLRFTAEEAVRKAANLFWRKGYEGSSLKDLLSELNILNGSFYNKFGDKKSLFLSAIKTYSDSVKAERLSVFEGQNFSKELRQFFDLILKDLVDPKKPKSCLIVNSIKVETLQDDDIHSVVKSEMSGLRDFFFHQLEQAKQSQQVNQDLPSAKVANIITLYLTGLFSHSLIETISM